MAKIAIIKVRMPHDVQWHISWPLKQLLKIPGLSEYRHRLSDLEGKQFMPQLTLPYLASLGKQICKQHGLPHTFEIIDERNEAIEVERFDMLWMTVNTPNALSSYEVADRARSRGIPVVLGGVHPTLMSEEASAHCTTIVKGEAELVLEKLLMDFEAGQFQSSYQAAGLAELKGLAWPDWRAMPADYSRWVVPVQTSRGCVNACSFCSTTRMQGARRRHRPIPELVAEIKMLVNSGIVTPEKVIFFTDNNTAVQNV